jgi:uncharacterized membrane protein
MSKGRLEAFSDGVFAILITILVLELKLPRGDDWQALRPMATIFVGYVLSFVFLGIYWNNHHHLLHAATRISGKVLWANLHLLFWLSLVPFTTAWMGETHVAPFPTAIYGAVLLSAGVGYLILERMLIALDTGSKLAKAVGRDLKSNLSALLYAVGIGLAFVRGWIAMVIYGAVALMWLVPDPRIESQLDER